MFNLKLMSFKTWMEFYDLEIENEDCPECNGEGELETIGDECDQEYYHKCHECGGSGKVINKKTYQIQLEHDREVAKKQFGEFKEVFI